MPSTSAGAPPATVDVVALVERRSFGSLQRVTAALCFLCMVMDGFDIQALGYTAPSIIRDWGIDSAVLGPVFAAGNAGVLVGALLFSMVADRIGRRPVLIGGTLFFAAATMLTGLVTSVPELLAMRVLCGLGLGVIAPNASALVGEYSPGRLRATAIMVVGVGLTLGAAIGGFLAAAIIPAFGWPAVFYLGGAIPVLIAAAMAVALPESLPLMAARGMSRAKLAGWANRIDPSLGATEATTFTAPRERKAGVPLVALFHEGRGVPTILFWIANFMNLLSLYTLSSWLPTVIRDAGYSGRIAVLAGATLQVGGTIGTFGLAWLVARRGFVPVLAASFVVAAASIAAVGRPGLPMALLFGAVAVAGWCVVGSQPGLNALSGTYYPTEARSTGVGAGLGVGRIGAIVGPIIGGRLMAAHWPVADLFLAAAAPSVIAAAAVTALAGRIGKR